MILPTKHVSPRSSLLGVGSLLLTRLDTEQTVSRLWERVRTCDVVGSFDRFVLALDLLHALGAVETSEGLLVRARR